jgi:hypothetical protein
MPYSFGGVGALTKLAIGPTGGTISRMSILSFSPQFVKTLADGSTKAIRGTLDHQATSVAEGLVQIRFRTTMYLTSTIMDILWPLLGVPLTSYTGTLVDSLPDSTVVLAPPGTKETTFLGCIPTDWTISGQKGGDPIIIDIGWQGRTFTQAANATFFTGPSTPPLVEGYTFPFADGAAAGNASTLSLPIGTITANLGFPQFRLSMNYSVVAEFNNSITVTNLMPTDHDLKFATSVLYNPADATSSTGSTEPLFDVPASGDVTGAALTLNFQRAAPFASPGNYQTTLTVANMKLLARLPQIVKNDFTRLPINAVGYASGGTALLTVVNKTNQP